MSAFPASPTNGQQANVNGVVYTYSSSVTAWQVTSNFVGNITVNQIQANAISVANNISGSLLNISGINNTNGNGIGNIGNSSVYFNTVHAKSTSAQYADLAEMYIGDADYAPGTVLVFGGEQEVTMSTMDADTAVAGVVSSAPAYIMNASLNPEQGYPVKVALQGRVECQVLGPVKKGDLLVSAGQGRAKSEPNARAGTIIGKALENLEAKIGTIEVVVGRT